MENDEVEVGIVAFAGQKKTRPSDDARRPLDCLLGPLLLVLLPPRLTPASSSCAWGDADGLYGRLSRLHIKIAAADDLVAWATGRRSNALRVAHKAATNSLTLLFAQPVASGDMNFRSKQRNVHGYSKHPYYYYYHPQLFFSPP